jgi:hypothetical protein
LYTATVPLEGERKANQQQNVLKTWERKEQVIHNTTTAIPEVKEKTRTDPE